MQAYSEILKLISLLFQAPLSKRDLMPKILSPKGH